MSCIVQTVLYILSTNKIWKYLYISKTKYKNNGIIPAIICYITHDVSWFDVAMYNIIIT